MTDKLILPPGVSTGLSREVLIDPISESGIGTAVDEIR
jgi:hypothetical protein